HKARGTTYPIRLDPSPALGGLMKARKATRRPGGRVRFARRARMQDASPRPSGLCPVVGISASASGLATFATFFEGMAPDSGAVFVLVQHLDSRLRTNVVDLTRTYDDLGNLL